MRIKGISLENFRNLRSVDVSLADGVNIIHGDNAQGKTNFLEALYFCAAGRSVRGSSDRDLIRFGSEGTLIRTEFERDGSDRSFDAMIRTEDGKTCKTISVDKIQIKKVSDIFGMLLVVMFFPDDLRLIKSGPLERRLFIDTELCHINPVYCHELRSYHHALKHRNALLKAIQKENGDLENLSVWDEQLCRYGRRVMAFRSDFLKQAGEYAEENHARMTDGKEMLELKYSPGIKEASQYEEILRRDRKRDIALGNTSSGVHKDDLKFIINGTDARAYGSQGQQRTAALSAKLAEIEIIKNETGTEPVLLLDDVLSELDESRQKFLLSRIGPLQTILTCTGVENILRKNLSEVKNAKVMRMREGSLSEE